MGFCHLCDPWYFFIAGTKISISCVVHFPAIMYSKVFPLVFVSNSGFYPVYLRSFVVVFLVFFKFRNSQGKCNFETIIKVSNTP